MIGKVVMHGPVGLSFTGNHACIRLRQLIKRYIYICCPVNLELAIVRDDKGWNIPRIGEKKQPCRSFFELG
jgi:hypothetical protein